MAGQAENTDFSTDFKDPKKINENDTFDHKKKTSDQTECTDISSFPNIDANDTNITKSEPGYPSILFPDRFTCKIPDHFFCKLCKNVVKDPQECTICETLFCLSCSQRLCYCPSGCPNLELKQISKFAFKMYNALSLSCKHQFAGCNFTSTLERVLAHEEICEYSVVQCENSLCDRFIIKPENKDPDSPLLCSDLCENIIRFSVLIDEQDVFGTLRMFTEYLDNCEKLVEIEVRQEMMDKFNKIEKCIKENENFRKKKERMEAELENRRGMFHPGKWNVKSCKWTCCGNNEIASIGCKQIG